ncbi:MAG: GntR family transcriptional regulator [Saccharofermentanales bacterium]
MTKNINSKYMQIKIDIESKIKSGHFPPKARVPSENEIAAQYGVSVITSRKSLELLVHDGLIYREKGRGSFVTDNSSTSNTNESYKNIVTFILLSYEFSDSSTMQLVKGAYTVLSEMKKSMIVEYSKDQPAREEDILEKCIRDKSAGVLLFSSDPEKNLGKLQELKKNHIPFVLVDRGITQFPVNIVSCYNLDGTYTMTLYLIQNGHERILFVSNNHHILTEKLRYQGYEQALAEKGITCDPELFLTNFHKNPLEILRVIEEQHPTAIMCVNDLIACKVTEILRENGINVPRDISVTGFDDADIAKYNHPKLTTIHQDFYKIGEKAAELLVDMILNNKNECSQIYLPIELIIRDSTATIKRN